MTVEAEKPNDEPIQPGEVELHRRLMEESIARVRAIRAGLRHRLTMDDILAARHEGRRY
ncbi:MAG: hypothetical protein ACREEW_10910 [Caulobacteraceae bacterium]